MSPSYFFASPLSIIYSAISISLTLTLANSLKYLSLRRLPAEALNRIELLSASARCKRHRYITTFLTPLLPE
nr:MAG TPA: hypothetical protein [Caudoviricetes sp.]